MSDPLGTFATVAQEAIPRIRLASIPDDQLVVVRGLGGTDRADAIRFRRRFDEWERYGLSGFVAADLEEVDVLMATRLERFEEIATYRRLDLLDAGLEVVPTFRRPHVTIAHANLDLLVSALRSCDHEVIPNEHHDGGHDHG